MDENPKEKWMNRILAMVLLVVVACSEATEPEAPYPATVLVSPKAAMVEMSTETVELTATVKDQNRDTMANVTVAWSSEDTSVAKVNSGDVSRIELGRNRLAGEIPAEVGLLKHLRGLNL